MADPTAEFFAGPAQQRAHLLPCGFSATVRVDLRRPDRVDHWYVTFREGEMSVSRDGEREADCVISADGAAFDRLVAGANPPAAAVRNEVSYRGSAEIFIYFQRLLPGPPDAHGPRRVAGRGGEDHGR